MSNSKIKIEATLAAATKKVWAYWTRPEHITKWNFASDDWQAILNNFKRYTDEN